MDLLKLDLLKIVFSALAFAEVMVFLASALALLAFMMKQAVNGIDFLVERVILVASLRKGPRGTRRRPAFNALAARRIPGGHNETF